MDKWPVGITASPTVRLVSTAASADLARRQRAALEFLGSKALCPLPEFLNKRKKAKKRV